MDTIFTNSENSKTSNPHRLLLNLSDQMNLKKVINMLLYQVLTFITHGKILKNHTKTIKLNFSDKAVNRPPQSAGLRTSFNSMTQSFVKDSGDLSNLKMWLLTIVPQGLICQK